MARISRATRKENNIKRVEEAIMSIKASKENIAIACRRINNRFYTKGSLSL